MLYQALRYMSTSAVAPSSLRPLSSHINDRSAFSPNPVVCCHEGLTHPSFPGAQALGFHHAVGSSALRPQFADFLNFAELTLSHLSVEDTGVKITIIAPSSGCHSVIEPTIFSLNPQYSPYRDVAASPVQLLGERRRLIQSKKSGGCRT